MKPSALGKIPLGEKRKIRQRCASRVAASASLVTYP